jgi:hypothetical protein
MPDNDRTDEPTPVPPPPIATAPSATGVVAGDESEVSEAPPSDDDGEE